MSRQSEALLYATEEDTRPTSYYNRASLLPSSSFRSKCTNGFRRSRSSSYTSLEEDGQPNNSFFSRKNLFVKDKSNLGSKQSYLVDRKDYDQEEDTYDQEGDDCAFFEKSKQAYSRQNLVKPYSSWKSSVLRAVGVKTRCI